MSLLLLYKQDIIEREIYIIVGGRNGRNINVLQCDDDDVKLMFV